MLGLTQQGHLFGSALSIDAQRRARLESALRCSPAGRRVSHGSGVERNWRGWAIDARQFGGPKLAWRHAVVLPESTTEMGAALESVRTGDVGNTASRAKRIPEQASALLQSAALDVTRYALTLLTKEQM